MLSEPELVIAEFELVIFLFLSLRVISLFVSKLPRLMQTMTYFIELFCRL